MIKFNIVKTFDRFVISLLALLFIFSGLTSYRYSKYRAMNKESAKIICDSNPVEHYDYDEVKRTLYVICDVNGTLQFHVVRKQK